MSTASIVRTIRTRWSIKSDPMLWLGMVFLVAGAAGIINFAVQLK